MVVYIEYAFLQNFLIDCALLRLAFYASKTPVSWKKICLSSLVGAIFALAFPLLVLPYFIEFFIKLATGALLCLLASGRLKTTKEWGRYALSCVFFFAFTFAFGGTLTALLPNFPAKTLVFASFALLTVFGVAFVRKLYDKRAVERFCYACEIEKGERRVSLSAFYDSGNFASYKNCPVCFLSPDIAWELWGEEMLEDRGQVRDEMLVETVNGEKRVRLFKARLRIGKEIDLDEVYFAVSANMLSRGYQALLHSQIFESGRKTKRG